VPLAFPIAMMGVGAAAWVPTSLSGLLGWWDSQDAASITQSGGAVSQWNDKSGNGKHVVQATGANQPAYSATGMDGSRPAISVTTTSKLLDNTSFTIGASSLTVVMVAYVDSTTGSNARLIGWFNGALDYAGATTAVIPLLAKTPASIGGYWSSADRGSASASYNTKRWFISEWNGSTGNHTIYVNGTAGSPAGWSSSNTWSGAGTLRMFNDNVTAGGACIGRYGEIFILNRVLTGGERTSIAAYMARWGL
jgi:hypothetical protein